ncbi:MAG: regulatory protein RecX [Aquabacterium sp.]|nr:regulatory protein RecX [Aquabacterium sp.]
MTPRPASLKMRALQWLAQREHSRNELRDKLLRLLQDRARREAAIANAAAPAQAAGDADADAKEADRAASPSTPPAADLPSRADAAAEVETLLHWLEAHGYLSQARFVESRVHARQSRYGNLRIRQELQQHGVTLDADAQQALKQTEFDRACEVWRRKFDAPAPDAAARVRQMRFLAGRGFSMEVIRRVVTRGTYPADDAEFSDA